MNGRRSVRSCEPPYEIAAIRNFDGPRDVLYDFNNAHQYVGSVLNPASGTVQAVLFEGGQPRMLHVPDTSFSVARAINGRGDIVGSALTSDGKKSVAFLYRLGRAVWINDLLPPGSGWDVFEALAINDARHVLAVASRDGYDQVVLVTPVIRIGS